MIPAPSRTRRQQEEEDFEAAFSGKGIYIVSGRALLLREAKNAICELPDDVTDREARYLANLLKKKLRR